MLDIRIKHACPGTAVACRTMGTTLGQRIREAREARGWSQLRLGESVGVSRAAVSQWESGESKGLRPENLVAAARALAVNVEWLVTGVGAMRPDEPCSKNNGLASRCSPARRHARRNSGRDAWE